MKWQVCRWLLAGALLSTLVTGPTCAAFASERDTPSISEQVAHVESEISVLRGRLRATKTGEESRDANYYFSAVMIVVAVAAGLIAVVALIATVMGYRMVRGYVESEFSDRVAAIFEREGRPILDAAITAGEQRLDAYFVETDARLADEIKNFRKGKG